EFLVFGPRHGVPPPHGAGARVLDAVDRAPPRRGRPLLPRATAREPGALPALQGARRRAARGHLRGAARPLPVPEHGPGRGPAAVVSLIVPNRNNEPVLDLFLEKLAAHTTHADFELIFVDDGSTDRSLEVLERWRASKRFKRFTLLRKPPTGIVDTLNLALE